jgi:enoyl-CoA hydratase/carnithine racemase
VAVAVYAESDVSSLLISHRGPVVTVSLNRPQVRNAFNEDLIAELTTWATGPMPQGVRVAVLRGEGNHFCAGADLTWMSKMIAYSHAENVRDAKAMAAMFQALDTLPVPLIGRIHGAALGGGYVRELLTSAPGAVSAAKALIAQVAGRTPPDVADLTAETIARHRVSGEGQGGMQAFLDKRPAPWTPDGQ